MSESRNKSPSASRACTPAKKVVVFANGRGTRMGRAVPKPLVELVPGQTLLRRVVAEAAEAAVGSVEVHAPPGYGSAFADALHGLPTAIIEAEPRGYFVDLLQLRRANPDEELVLIDADLVVPDGTVRRFASDRSAAWLAIGVTRMPEHPSGRPAWVRLDRTGRLTSLSRTDPEAHRTVGMFRWAVDALTATVAADYAGIMDYVRAAIDAGRAVDGWVVPAAHNVNTPEDLAAARRLLHTETHCLLLDRQEIHHA